MKFFIALILLCSIVFTGFSQQTPESFLASIPLPPSQVCDATIAVKDNFSNKIEQIKTDIDALISKRKKEYENFMDGNVDKMQQNVAKQMGLSPEEMAKLNNGDEISEAQAMAIANKMMGQFNMTMSDAQKLSEMSPAEQEAFSQKQTVKMMADAQANPGKYTANQDAARQKFELVAEQTKIAQMLQAEEDKFYRQVNEIKLKDVEESKKLDLILAPLLIEMRSINDGEGSNAADAAHAYEVATKMYAHRLKYCQQMSPLYYNVLNEYFASVKNNLPNRYRLQEIINQITLLQIGENVEGVSKDLMALESISSYLNLMRDAYKFAGLEKPTK